MTDKKQSIQDEIAAIQAAAKKKIEQKKAQLQKVEAREKAQERKNETRRKVIAGALIINHAEKNPSSEVAKKLTSLIDEYCVKDTERKLFDLDLLPEQEQVTRIARHKEENKRKADFNEVN